FSSRRRHTRLVSDWSSDVCSSDLGHPSALWSRESWPTARSTMSPGRPSSSRSEERRVGKEGRSRGAPDHYKKKTEKRTQVCEPGTGAEGPLVHERLQWRQ